MRSPTALNRHEAPPGFLTHFTTALRLLSEAYGYAVSLGRDVWDFAVEMTTLREAGLSRSDLRWLACKGYVVHGVEARSRSRQRRYFHRNGPLALRAGTCFVLTDAGAKVAEAARGISKPAGPEPAPAAKARVPHWDGARRELWVAKSLVKRFLVPADNQELLLAAFEEEGWPPRIDDPLPPHRHLDPKRRLGEAIRRLNRNQKTRLLRFRSNGHGNGVCWELVRATARRVPGDCP
jgi:hypothetical protein